PTRSQIGKVMMRAGLFVATFSLIFILIGLGTTAVSGWLTDNRKTLEDIAGVLIIALGLFFVAALFIPKLNRDWHPQALMASVGNGGPVVAGAAFAIAWTPCIGPTLGAILLLAQTTGTALQGGGLLAVYSLGLAIPFLLAAFAFNRAT